MIIKVISAIFNEDTKVIEIVKEITDDLAQVTYHLHIVPPEAVNKIAARNGAITPKDAIDLLIYMPYVTNADTGTCELERVQACKLRLNGTPALASRRTAVQNDISSLPERYWPLDGEDVYSKICAMANTCDETIQEAKNTQNGVTLNEPRTAAKHDGTTERSSSQEGRPRQSRAYISLGTTR